MKISVFFTEVRFDFVTRVRVHKHVHIFFFSLALVWEVVLIWMNDVVFFL